MSALYLAVDISPRQPGGYHPVQRRRPALDLGPAQPKPAPTVGASNTPLKGFVYTRGKAALGVVDVPTLPSALERRLCPRVVSLGLQKLA